MHTRERSGLSIPAAIVIAAVVVVAVPILYVEISARVALREINATFQEWDEEAKAQRFERQRQRSIQSLERKIAERHRAAAVRLPGSQQCVAGTVVIQRTAQDGTASFVQLLEHGRPVRCKGRNRLEPRP